MRGTQYAYSGRDFDRPLEQAFGRRVKSTGSRENRVVKIDDGVTFAMNQRWKLVHPFAVKALVVGIELGEVPATVVEQMFSPHEI